MLIQASQLIGTPILSVQASGKIAEVTGLIIDPDSLKTIAFRVGGGVVGKGPANILDVKSIREYSKFGMVIDSEDEFIEPSDVVKIEKILGLNFDLINLKVETKKGSNLGHITDYTLDALDFMVQQLIVKRPIFKSFLDPELTIPRREIVEITDYKVIVKDEEKVIKARAEKEDFIPNFVNPFRKTEPVHSPADTGTPADTDSQ